MNLSLNYNMVPPFLGSAWKGYPARRSADTNADQILGEWSKMAKGYWLGAQGSESYFNTHIDPLFSIRIKSINWQHNNPKKEVDAWETLTDERKALQVDPARALLYDNLLFAIRVSQRSLRELSGKTAAPPTQQSVPPQPMAPFLPEVNFQQFIGLVSLTTPDAILPSIIDLFTASLRIEFALNLTYVMDIERLEPDNTKIEDLATFVAEAGQEFGAITKELMPKRPAHRKNTSTDLSAEVLDENRLLAELDLPTLSDL